MVQSGVCDGLTLGQVRGQVRHFLSADVRPVEVVVQILLVVALCWAVVEGAAAWKRQTLHERELKLKHNFISADTHSLLMTLCE